MKGRYRGYSKTAGIALMAVCILFVPVFIFMTNIPMLPALIVTGLMLAMIILLAVFTEFLPCSFSADEYGFTMKRLFITRRYEYGDIGDIVFECCNTTRSGKAVMELSLTERSGSRRSFYEISSVKAAELINDPGKYGTQLSELFEYINQVR